MAVMIGSQVINGSYPVSRTTGGALVNGTSGTFAGSAEKGTIVVRLDTGVVYANTGTKASPTWVVVGSQT